MALNNIKADLRKIEQFIKTPPLASEGDLKAFLQSEKLTYYSDFANHTLAAYTQRQWHLFTGKINKHR